MELAVKASIHEHAKASMSMQSNNAVLRQVACLMTVVVSTVGGLAAVDTIPVRVVATQGALRIQVEAKVGGIPTTIQVQLDA